MSFSTITIEQWQEKVRTELKGKDPESLYKEQLSGAIIKTVYTIEDRPTGAGNVQRSKRGWKRRQRISRPSVVDSNKQILADLAGGIDDVWVHFQNVFSSQDGIFLDSIQDLDRLFDGVHLELIRLQISAEDILSLEEEMKGFLEKNAEKCHIDWQWDPLMDMARYGILYDDVVERTKQHVAWSEGCSASWKPLCIDLRDYHLAGATSVHELALMLATMAEYQRWFGEKEIAELSDLCWVQFSIGRDMFENIAKLRAARKLWAGFGKVCGAEKLECTIRAVTSERMLCYYDQWVNILRTTTSCTSAVWGGADSVTNLPYDLLYWEQSERSARVSRNIHSVLDEECHLGHIGDPTAGSYFIENLTEDLCQRAWAFFQDIERAGGLMEFISSGQLFTELNACLSARQQRIETRKMPITGITEFANPADTTAENQEIETLMSARLAEAQIRQIQEVEEANRPIKTIFPGVHRVRDAGLIETMRASIGEAGQQRAFLATLGSEADWKPRATFAGNFFAIMGWEVEVHQGIQSTDDISALMKAYQESGCRVVCICGENGAYGEYLSLLASGFKEQGAHIILAGRDRDSITDQDIYIGVNIREVWTLIIEHLQEGEG